MMIRTARILLLVLCLAMSTAQGWIEQSHLHGAGLADVAGLSIPVADDELASQWRPQPQSQDCLFCAVAARGGAVLLATAQLEPVAPPLHSFALRSIDRAVDRAVQRSHHWASRGPPHA
jgi:hypothetical protein